MKPQPIGRYAPTPSYEELQAEIERLRLTDEEREAIAWAASAARNVEHPSEDTLRGLLKRLG